MDYCGVEFTVISSVRGSSWKWKLSILNKDKMRTSGESASRSAAIDDEAVEVLRPFVNTMHNRVSGSGRLADAAVGALVQRLEAKGIATDETLLI
jgi:hypothetical protein